MLKADDDNSLLVQQPVFCVDARDSLYIYRTFWEKPVSKGLSATLGAACTFEIRILDGTTLENGKQAARAYAPSTLNQKPSAAPFCDHLPRRALYTHR